MNRITVLSIFGTRPEAIKFAPVLAELAARPQRFRSLVCVTGQHRGLLDQVLDLFGIRPDFDLDLMRPGQSLPDLTARLMRALPAVVQRTRPDVVLAQGDTTTCLAAALVAYYERVPLAHIEAGLRTGDPYAPFPEEMNRRLVDALAAWRYAPTPRARDALLREGCDPKTVRVTGNTIVDAMLWARRRVRALRPPLPVPVDPSRLLLVTAHRRESFGPGIAAICRALVKIVRARPDVRVVFPLHPNPNVRGPARRILGRGDIRRIHLLSPLDYLTFVALLDRADVVLTDSGGIQEEAASLGLPLLVARDKTERPEALEVPTTELVGTDTERIRDAALRWLDRPPRRSTRVARRGPFGDGRAAVRIVRHLATLSPSRGTAARSP